MKNKIGWTYVEVCGANDFLAQLIFMCNLSCRRMAPLMASVMGMVSHQKSMDGC